MREYKNKKILITGNTGFKGTWLTLTLKLLGANIVGYSDKRPKKKSVISTPWLKENINQYYGKVENFKLLRKVIHEEKPDLIFHLAAQPLVIKSYKHPLQTFQSNILGTTNLLESIRIENINIPCLVITTDKVYQVKGKNKYKESDILEGIDPYSTSKVCTEHISKCYSRLGLKIITARAGNVIGGGDWAKNRIIPDIINSYIMKKPIKLRNPSYTRPWLYILDVIEGYLILGKALLKIKKGNYFDTFNLAPSSNKVYDVLALTKVVLKKLNFEKFEFDSSLNNKENQFLSLSACKIKKHLGWKSKTSFKNLIHLFYTQTLILRAHKRS